MNDDFLHRIRVEPPADFVARLKTRLDRQLPPPSATPRRSLFRALALGLLFGGTVFAITLLTVNGIPDFARSSKQRATTETIGNANRRPDHAIDNDRQPSSTTATAQPASPGPGLDLSRAEDIARKTTTPAATASINGVAQTGPRPNFSLVTPKALQAYTTFMVTRRLNISITTTDTTTEALVGFCADPGTGKSNSQPAMASVTRRITRAEFDVCSQNIGNIAEVQMGHQAIVLARSKLYGAFALTPTEIFLALAAEIPDPAHPDRLIANPNMMWSDVNGALENEPIEVFGPDPSSAAAIAFRELLLQPGCGELPVMVQLRHSDPERYERACKTVRKDSAYVEIPDASSDILARLQSKPNAIGILGFNLFVRNASAFTASQIAGVAPTRETITAGTYPGSRTLYLYVNQRRSGSWARYAVAGLLEPGGYLPEAFEVIPPDAPEISSVHALPPQLPDLKL
jgi:phosphate transport system substrate-binding protein